MRFFATGQTTLVIGLLMTLVLSSAGCAAQSPTDQVITASPTVVAAKAPPTAVAVPSDPRVGAVFVGGDSLHTCTGSVLDSAGGDLILTAAHCMAAGVDTMFVAGLKDSAPSEDYWHVDAVYLDPRWVHNQDPMADFAIARVSRDAGGSVAAQAGSHLKLGQAPKPGTVVSVSGYGMGVGGGPIGCRTATVSDAKGFPALDCAELVDGLSGAPWIVGASVVGVIGGLHAGGCADESLSYSPPFGDAVEQLLARAEAGGPPDTPPAVFNDDCG